MSDLIPIDAIKTSVPDSDRPKWLTVRAPTGEAYHNLKRLMRSKSLNTIGEEMGFKWVEFGPLVRSSYNAEAQARTLSRKK